MFNIWDSVLAMTIIDLGIISLTIFLYIYFINIYGSIKTEFKARSLFWWAWALLIALTVTSLFHIADLYIMYIYSVTHTMKEMMSAMELLHLNASWYKTIVSVSAIAYSMIFSMKYVIPEITRKRTQQLKEKTQELEVELDQSSEELKKLNISLEQKVKERTEELNVKNEELEKVNKYMVDREKKMVELKEEIAKIKKVTNI